jgi:LysM repeat protein
MHTSDVRTSSTPASSFTLRPRNRRLISGLSDLDGHNDNALLNANTAPNTRAASPLPSPFDSRGGSPVPRERLSRPVSSRGNATVTGDRRRNESPIAGLWGNSWSTLQGFANDLLGSDGGAAEQRTRRPLGRFNVSRGMTSAPSGEWGPQAPTSVPGAGSIGTGSREEVEDAIRAQKRKDLLTRGESYADSKGRFKRRTSDEDRGGVASSAPPGDHERRDALVYLHTVRREDTLAGITIRYNCSANALRKANRMWPNDTVQSRTVLTLPVDACGVKGKPLSELEAMDLLDDEKDALSAGRAEEVQTPKATTATTNGNDLRRNRTNSASTNTSTQRASLAAISSNETDPPWHHDSWILFPGASKPTEIARLSRNTMGYFPPARRKSASYSDLDTPSTSLDLARASTSDNPVLSPLRQDAPQRPRRSRRTSNATSGYFPSYLAGPGGVGTMNKNVSSPGPGQDGLNKFFARHLPDVAPPKNQQSLYQPEMPLYSDDTSGATTPGSMALNNGNINIENVGGAIESWMRRVASKAKDALEPAERAKVGRASVGTPSRGLRGVGDLIEMTDEFEIGVDEDIEGEEEAERGRRGSVVHSKLLDPANFGAGEGAGNGGSSSSSAYFNSGAAGTMATGAGRRERSKVDYTTKGGKDD